LLYIEILTKDWRQLKFMFYNQNKEGDAIFSTIEELAFRKEEKKTFAFIHKNLEDPDEGWNIFCDVDEYMRMGIEYIEENCAFRLFKENIDGETCSSYPQRVIVPKEISDKEVVDCSKFRAKERFQVLTYYYKLNKASIWRSSQPKVNYIKYAYKKELNYK